MSISRKFLAALLAIAPASAVLAADAADKGEKEETVTVDQLPDAVKETLKKEAGEDGKIGKIEKETEDDKAIYEAKVVLNGKKWELKIAEDGKLLSKKEKSAKKDEDKDGDDKKKDDDKGSDSDKKEDAAK